MAQKSGLGKGLGALIPTWQEETFSSSPSKDSIVNISVERIFPNPHQPRKNFDTEDLEDLASSIREHGIIQPLILVSTNNLGEYNLIAGERRLRAARLAGLQEVPAIVRSATQQEQLEFAIIENVQREDLNPLERAQAFQNLIDEFSLTHEDIAKRVGKNRVTITNTIRLLNLPESVQQALQNQEISEGHARSLLMLSTTRSMESALETIISLGLNVRQTEVLVKKLSGKAPRKPNPQPRAPELDDLESRLRQHFHTKVSIAQGAHGGNITIFYYSDEELNAILDLLNLNG